MRLPPVLISALAAALAVSPAVADDTECQTEVASVDEPSMDVKSLVEDAAKRWLACQGDEIVVPAMRLEATLDKTTNNAPLPYYIHRYDAPWPITIGLTEAIAPDMTPGEIEERIEFVSNDGLPTPGLSVPDWRIVGQTPSTHITEGITVTEVSEGRLVINIKTRLFAIYGRDTRVHVMADAPTPEHGYFQVRQDIPIDVTLDLAVSDF